MEDIASRQETSPWRVCFHKVQLLLPAEMWVQTLLNRMIENSQESSNEIRFHSNHIFVIYRDLDSVRFKAFD